MADEAKGDGSTSPEDSLDKARFELEQWRVKEDVKLRRDELEIRRREVKRSRWSSPLFLAVAGLVATVVAGLVQNAVQSAASRDQEKRKFETTLIQEALKTDDQLTAARRLRRLLDLHLISDQGGTIAGWVNDPSTIPVDNPREAYVGEDRKAAKLSIGSGKVETFMNLASLIASLPSTATMLSHSPSVTTDANSRRVAEEQRNVSVRTFLYAASREADNDFHLIIGEEPHTSPEIYMTAEVSGLPPSTNPAFQKLDKARTEFETFFGKNLPGPSYDYYNPPIPIQIEGSLFFDARFSVGPGPGPPSLKSRMPTIWEIHPVTSFTER